MKEYLAYKGSKFIVEWYFDKKGQSQPLDFFNNLSMIERKNNNYLCFCEEKSEIKETG